MREKLIRLVVHENIHYVLFKMRGKVFVKGNVKKASEASQEADQQIEAPTGTRHTMVLL